MLLAQHAFGHAMPSLLMIHKHHVAGLLAVLAAHTLRLKPLFSEAILGSRSWAGLRLYCRQVGTAARHWGPMAAATNHKSLCYA